MKRAAIIAIGIVLCLTGCQKRARTVSLPPAPPPVAAAPEPIVIPDPVPAPVPPPEPIIETPPPAPPVPTMIEIANMEFESGNYPQAAKAYESYLQLSPQGEDVDEALFHLGLIYASPEASIRDWTRASGFLKQLVEKHPRSTLKPQAALILSLYSELTQLRADSQQRIKQLSTELEKLKKIDAARRKR